MEIKNTPYKMLDPENCVMCGMCLNNCPTYNISNNESESPRGRISIIHGLNESMLEPSQSALSHINSCTLCLACESICPAKVNFYQLINISVVNTKAVIIEGVKVFRRNLVKPSATITLTPDLLPPY